MSEGEPFLLGCMRWILEAAVIYAIASGAHSCGKDSGQNSIRDTYNNKVFIEDTLNINKKFVNPGSLEFKLKDLNDDGLKETIVKYDGKTYLFRVDSLGKPLIQEYEVDISYK
ncbi:MAG: hypothetical protein ACP5N2_04395 [Candidatus Nanoarchaeia archaeon]